jgi:hypothetical protein
MTTLWRAIQVANEADDAFAAAVESHGLKSRWDVTRADRARMPKLALAYDAKVAADRAVSEAYAATRTMSNEQIRASFPSAKVEG